MSSIMIREKNPGEDDGNLLLVVITTHKQVNDRIGLTLSRAVCVYVFAWSSFPPPILLLFFSLVFFFALLRSVFFHLSEQIFFMYMTQVKIEVNREIDINCSLSS